MVLNVLKTILVLLIPPLSLYGGNSVLMQTDLVVTSTRVSYVFGKEIVFSGSIVPNQAIQDLSILFRDENDHITTVGKASVSAEGDVSFTHNVSQVYVQPFSEIVYWYAVELENGQIVESAEFSFFYEDNRFEWQVLEDIPFRVHWHTGDIAFAQSVLDAAHRGLKNIDAILQPTKTEDIDIYVYSSVEDYQSVKGIFGPLWAGGHADPSGSNIIVSLPPNPDQRLQVDRKIPHEVAHIVIYWVTGTGYEKLPVWINEGIASNNELYPNPDYPFLLEEAYKNENLLPLEYLCNPFPADTAGALLAYAESTSIVQYLLETYGKEGIQASLRKYSHGVSCNNGTNVAPINLHLNLLEREWRIQVFAENYLWNNLKKIAPWLIVIATVFVSPVIVLIGLHGNSQKQK